MPACGGKDYSGSPAAVRQSRNCYVASSSRRTTLHGAQMPHTNWRTALAFPAAGLRTLGESVDLVRGLNLSRKPTIRFEAGGRSARPKRSFL
jgi:hypothetical protein